MSDIMDGWNSGERMYQNRVDAERQKKADEWAAEQQAQTRAQWQRDIAAEDELKKISAARSAAPTDQTLGLATKYGFEPQPTTGNNPSAYVAPQQPEFGLHPMRQSAVDEMNLATTRRDYTGAANARAKLDQMDAGSQAAMMQKRVMDAPAEKLASFAQQFTDSQHIPGEMAIDSKTGLATLTLTGGKPIQMTKVQLAKYVTGLWKQSVGDPTGVEDLASIDKSLADMADKMYGRVKDSVANTNDVVLKGNTMRNDNQRTANSGAELGLRRKMYESKEPDQKLVARMNDIVARYESEEDPAKRRALEQEHRLLTAQVATQMGKPMQLNQGRGSAPAGDGKFTKEPEVGTIGSVNGQRVQVQADGSYGAPGAETDPKAFIAAKYPKLVQTYAGRISVTPDGRGLYIGTPEDFARMGGRVTAFDYKDPADMAELEASLRTEETGLRGASEFAKTAQVRTAQGLAMPTGRVQSAAGLQRADQMVPGYGPRVTGQPDAKAPSIYASPEEWAQYRASQR